GERRAGRALSPAPGRVFFVPLAVARPVAPAIATTKRMLFQDFDGKKFVKWLNVGFCAFLSQLEMLLAQLMGIGFYIVYLFFVISMSRRPPVQTQEWFEANWPTLVAIAAGVGAVAYVVYLALLWVGSRGQFMFLDAVVQDRAAIREDWKEFATAGRSLFRFRAAANLVSLALLAGCGGPRLFLPPSPLLPRRRWSAAARPEYFRPAVPRL